MRQCRNSPSRRLTTTRPEGGASPLFCFALWAGVALEGQGERGLKYPYLSLAIALRAGSSAASPSVSVPISRRHQPCVADDGVSAAAPPDGSFRSDLARLRASRGVFCAGCWVMPPFSQTMVRIRTIVNPAVVVRRSMSESGGTVFHKIKHLPCVGPYGPVCT